MSVTRLLFLAEYRIPHACFSLQWDHMLTDVDHTIVAHTPNLDADLIKKIFVKHGINCEGWQYINDDAIYQRYPQVNHWVFPDDYRTYWLRQQAIKLSYIDMIGADIMLMHDPDTFMTEPYQCHQGGVLNLMSLLHTTQGSYEGVFEAITGLPRISPHCFVTEFMPVRNHDWLALRELLQTRWPHQHWLDAIIDAVPGLPTVPPWGTGNIIKWFSEYEFLGNWSVHCGDVAYHEQRRFEYNDLALLENFDPRRFNAVCDAIPDLRHSMQFDWQSLSVQNFARHLDTITQCLAR